VSQEKVPAMKIEKIFVATKKGEAQQSVDAVRVVRDRGIEGDRNFGQSKYPGRNITFVEAEAIERFNTESKLSIEISGTRRNVVTRGVRLNELVGQEFAIGDARFRGTELCEPCALLGSRLKSDAITAARVVQLFVHRAGLRADVLATGTICVGDILTPDSQRA
jgi:MOSC domain-containing protein YiiM